MRNHGSTQMAMWRELEHRLWRRLNFKLRAMVDSKVRDDAWANLRSVIKGELEGAG